MLDVAERGVQPQVPAVHQRALRAVRSLFTPLLPDDYLEMINPLWSTQELRGRIVTVERETADAATVVIKPGWKWAGHTPGQYLRIGLVVDGIHHWRAYSLPSDPDREDGCISITPKLVDAGVVSPYLVREAVPGVIARLGGVEGTFVLPDPVPPKLLFICERYDLPYNTRPFLKQLGTVQRTILRLALPGGTPRPKPGPYRSHSTSANELAAA